MQNKYKECMYYAFDGGCEDCNNVLGIHCENRPKELCYYKQLIDSLDTNSSLIAENKRLKTVIDLRNEQLCQLGYPSQGTVKCGIVNLKEQVETLKLEKREMEEVLKYAEPLYQSAKIKDMKIKQLEIALEEIKEKCELYGKTDNIEQIRD